MRISKVHLAECGLALPYTLRLGSTQITTRDYVVLRIETDSGLYGEAIGYPRGTPLFETLSLMAAKVMNQKVSMRREVMHQLENSNVPGRAALTRGLSLFDIGLWDIACKVAQQPLFQYLGAFRTQAEVTAVAGYYMDRRPISDIADEVRGLLDAGHHRVKVMLNGNDPDFDRAYAAAVTKDARGKVAADAHWSWNTLTEAKRLCRDLDSMGLDFIEDPFAANDTPLTHELQKDLVTPIAAGEDVFGPRAFADLARGIGILRVDATTCGGITGAIEAIHIAAACGKSVFPHVFAPLHVHLACAFPNVEAAEYIPSSSGADPIEKLLVELPEICDGKIKPGEHPGVGIRIDWEKVKHSARHMTVITSTDS